MKIQDAIESGKHYRRSEWPEGSFHTQESRGRFSKEDVIADDWEVVDDSFIVTEFELYELLKKYARLKSGHHTMIEELRSGKFKKTV